MHAEGYDVNYPKFLHGATSYTLSRKNINVMIEFLLNLT